MASMFVDDTSSNISYGGAWQARSAQEYVGRGPFGNPFRNTLHRLEGTQGSFSYNFTGAAVKAIGTVEEPARSGGVSDPDWTCSVDGKPMRKNDISYPRSNFVFCEVDDLNTNGNHTLTVTVTSTSKPFLLDYLRLAIDEDAPAQKADIHIPYNDERIRQSGKWNKIAPGIVSGEVGCSLSFDFIGTGLSWLGTIHRDVSLEPSKASYSMASYSIDAQQSVSIRLPGLPSRNISTQYLQEFFAVTNLPRTHHNITVTYNGSESPLALDRVIIFDSTTNPSTFDLEAGVSDTGTSEVSPPPIGVISGAIVGGVLGLLAFVGLAWYLIRRCRRQRILDNEWKPALLIEEHYIESYEPYSAQPTSSTFIQPPRITKSRELEPPMTQRLPFVDPRVPGSDPNLSIPTTVPPDSTSAVYQHEDSGIRVGGPQSLRAEIPPSYSQL